LQATVEEKVGMKRFSIILGFIGAIVSWGNAFAVPTMPLTPCPTTFTCAFDAAEVRPLADPTTPGAPSVYVGYLSFNAGVPTLDSLGTMNGNLQSLATAVGTCTAGTATPTMGVLDFTGNGGPKFEFVSDNRSGALELRVMIVADSSNTPPSAVNLGTCTQQ
jgi:hypothetical protein